MPVWGPIGQEVYERTYSRRKPDGTQEVWEETVARVIEGNLGLIDAPAEHQDQERELLSSLFSDFRALPAGRHLWASGADTTLGLSNCHRAGWGKNLSDHFGFTFDQLMLGGGVGANYSSEYLTALPAVQNRVDLELVLSSAHPDRHELASWVDTVAEPRPGWIVPDSRQGWTNALAGVIEAHVGGAEAISVDLSIVRPRGEAIKGFGGTASGPGPLAQMLIFVNDILNDLEGQHLTPLAAMEIDHAIAQCVVAGNVRRSARMSILHWNDPHIFDFISCKADASKHWTTNISVEVDDQFFDALREGSAHAQAVLEATVSGMYSNGEPGFYNSSLASHGETGDVRATNPCGEIALEAWEQCTLGHVNLSAFAEDHEGALEAFRAMARYLIRATTGASSDPRQDAVKQRNHRIGVGFYGFADWAAKLGTKYSDIPHDMELLARLKDYADAVRSEADRYSEALGLESVPVKVTTVAPTGTIAKLAGVSEGLQPPYARYFIRRVRYSADDPKLEALEAKGHHLEPCVYSANTTVVSFVCEDPILSEVDAELVEQSDEVSLQAYLGVQAAVQDLYADNAISITGNFNRSQLSKTEFQELLTLYLPDIKGFTAMPEDGRPQSPYERLTLAQYEAMAGPKSVGQAIDDCANGACPVK